MHKYVNIYKYNFKKGQKYGAQIIIPFYIFL